MKLKRPPRGFSSADKSTWGAIPPVKFNEGGQALGSEAASSMASVAVRFVFSGFSKPQLPPPLCALDRKSVTLLGVLLFTAAVEECGRKSAVIRETLLDINDCYLAPTQMRYLRTFAEIFIKIHLILLTDIKVSFLNPDNCVRGTSRVLLVLKIIFISQLIFSLLFMFFCDFSLFLCTNCFKDGLQNSQSHKNHHGSRHRATEWPWGASSWV